MKKNLVFFILAVVALSSCSSYKSVVTPGYKPPSGKDIAVAYLRYSDVTVGNQATKIFEDQLSKCGRLDFVSADRTEGMLQKKNIMVIPQRITIDFIRNLKAAVGTKYILIGTINEWRAGVYGQGNGSVSLDLNLYDLDTGTLAWESGGALSVNIFNTPAGVFESLASGLLQSWEEFCPPKK